VGPASADEPVAATCRLLVDKQYPRLSTISRQWVDRLSPTRGRHGGSQEEASASLVIGEDT
jgi:hypothetical protein